MNGDLFRYAPNPYPNIGIEMVATMTVRGENLSSASGSSCVPLLGKGAHGRLGTPIVRQESNQRNGV